MRFKPGVELPKPRTITVNLPTTAFFDKLVRRYIGKAIQRRIDDGLSSYLDELRRVSVVFVNVDLESLSFETLNLVLRSMQKVIARQSQTI